METTSLTYHQSHHHHQHQHPQLHPHSLTTQASKIQTDPHRVNVPTAPTIKSTHTNTIQINYFTINNNTTSRTRTRTIICSQPFSPSHRSQFLATTILLKKTPNNRSSRTHQHHRCDHKTTTLNYRDKTTPGTNRDRTFKTAT